MIAEKLAYIPPAITSRPVTVFYGERGLEVNDPYDPHGLNSLDPGSEGEDYNQEGDDPWA